MRFNWIVIIILTFVIVVLGIKSCREQREAAGVLRENERLVRENRDLRNSLTMSNRNAEQIADRATQDFIAPDP